MHEPKFFTNGRKGKRRGILGVCLGVDATTEHECGISALRLSFGSPLIGRHGSQTFFLSDFEIWQQKVDEQGILAKMVKRDIPLPPMGMEKRRICEIPRGLTWLRATNGREGFGYYDRRIGFEQKQVDDFTERRYSWDLVGGWSDESFYVLATSDKSKRRLKKIYEAVLEKNAMFTLPMSFFTAEGLCIIDLNEFPKEREKDYYEIDKKQFDSERALHETGIQKFLMEQKKDFFSLGRYHEFDDGIWRAWLNPSSNGVNGKNNSGWYTIDELRQWGEGKGPVIRKTR